MATNTNTPTTLGKLEFSEIKQSLTDYLKNQSIFSGYNFEGSAMQTLIDLLSYNTFYYAYYANMINAEAFLDSAQKEDSVISLCKPLGYTVPSRTAATAFIKVSALPNNNAITAGTRFTASNSNGVNYSFYNLTDVAVVDQGTESFPISEASAYISFDALPTFDFDGQKIAIAADGFDLASISVTITERLTDTVTTTEEWTLVQNIGYTAKVNENIYFIERTSTGFAILFGSKNSVGRSIDDSIEKIIIRYILTNGADGNNLSLFASNLGGTITLVSESSGGKSSPNLDEVRFLAPKWFAAQERAVTVNDYKALLLQSGFFASQYDFNVYGGQDLTPPKYGRVFITSNIDPTEQTISDMINFLKERSVITILPEYAVARALNVYVDFGFTLGPATDSSAKNRSRVLAKVKSLFQTYYEKVGQFNVEFSASDFIQLLRLQSDPDINTLIISPDNFNIYVREPLSTGVHHLELENSLYLPISTNIQITEPFNSPIVSPNKKAVLKMYVSTNAARNTKTNLQLYEQNDDGTETAIKADVGYFIAYKGVIHINSGVISDTATLNVSFLQKSYKSGTNNSVTFTYGNVVLA
jgi:hypothetical protein